MKLKVASPASTIRSDGSREAFWTYWNYLRGWGHLIDEHWVAPAPPHKNPAALPSGNVRQIELALGRSWGHLKALRVLNEEGLSADVLAVHPPIAYYAVYHGAKAMLHARNVTVSNRHNSTLRTLGDLASKSQLLDPFSARCSGHPDQVMIEGIPCKYTIPNTNLGRPSVDELSGLAAWSLKTTHNSRLDSKLNEERERVRRGGRTRLANGTRDREALKLGTTTVFDLLYRYRLIANYGRTDDFNAFADESDATDFGWALLAVAEKICEMTEAEVAAKLGSQHLNAMSKRHPGSQIQGFSVP